MLYFLLLVLSLVGAAQALEIQLEASFDGLTYSPMGVIEGDLRDRSLPATLTRSKSITSHQQQLLRALAERNGFFSLRAEGKKKGSYVQASVRAACLASGQPTVKEQARVGECEK